MIRVLGVISVAMLAGTASGQAVGVRSFTGGTQFSSFNSDGDTVGWFFRPNVHISVTHLGFWDALQDGLAGEHQVGIFRVADQSLMGSVIVQAGTASQLIGQWRYERLAMKIPLIAGEEYVLGADYNPNPPGPIDNYISGAANIVTAPEFTFLANAVDALPGPGPNPFTYPATRGAATGRFGPNMIFIPAPGVMGMMAIAGLAVIRRRR